MLRISIHSSPPSQASRFNRTDWIDIGYQVLAADAEYKIVLVESGKGAREPVYLHSYPRWSSSLWDLVARAIALSYWHAPAARDFPNSPEPSATDADGEPVQIDDVTPARPKASRIRSDADAVTVKRADEAGLRCAYATHTTAQIRHYPSRGTGGRLLSTLLIAHDPKSRGMYGASVEEDPMARRLIPRFTFSPTYLSPAELVLRGCLHMLTGNINVLPECPIIKWPTTDVIDGKHFTPIHRIEEPARTGFLRWLRATKQTPQPEKGASLGRVPAGLFATFLMSAI